MTNKQQAGNHSRQLLGASKVKKRRKERATILFLATIFLILTWVEFRLFGMSETLPFQHSIFFFGLVNFNIVLFLLLMFLIFRNIVKNFSEREGGPIGSSLKNKLIAAFVGFSFVPTVLMFTVSVFYINNSFERWFNDKMSNVLKSAIEVTNNYYVTAKKKNYHYAESIARDLKNHVGDLTSVKKILKNQRERLAIDSVEFYPSLLAERVLVVVPDGAMPTPPPVSLEFRQKGIVDEVNTSTIHHYAGGDLVRVIVPVSRQGERGAIVVSSFIPLSLINKMDDIAAAYENIKDSDPLAYPIKSIYIIILVLMTMIILLGATWFGFYLARQLSVPLEELAQATQGVLRGEYQQVDLSTGSPEINRLISNFNTMTAFLDRSEKELKEASNNLRQTLNQLNDHSRYIEVVLANITTGVISIDNSDIVTVINSHAADLLKIDSNDYVGKHVDQVLSSEYRSLFKELFEHMRAHNADTVEKEIQINVEGRPLILFMTVTMLKDMKGSDLGKVLVFEDVSLVRSAQRAAAWTEVARRIAHEIKNPLTPISLAAQRLERKFGDSITDPAFKDCTTMIVEQVDGLKNLVNEFSQFARMPKTKPAVCSLNSTISEALKLFQQGDKKDYALSFTGDPTLPEFLFDPEQIKRVITNLVDNAVEGLQGRAGGAIDITLKYDPTLKIVRIDVTDNGAGLPKYLRGRIFEPYVTTKKHGTGLGLAIVKRAVEDHNGFIRAIDNEPTGTRFVIELPVIVSNTNNTILKTADDKDVESGMNPTLHGT